MVTFRITAPDGTKYDVTAPDGATEAQALARVRAQHQSPSQQLPSQYLMQTAPVPAEKPNLWERIKDAVYVPPDKREPMPGIGELASSTPRAVATEMGNSASRLASDFSPLKQLSDFLDPNTPEWEKALRPPLPVQMAIDALGAAFSPATGMAKNLVGRPVESATGINRDIVGNVITAAIPFGAMAKGASEIGQAGSGMTKAQRLIAQRMADDIKAGGPTANDILAQAAKTPNKPVTIADFGGENTRALLGNVSRQPGPARQVAKQFYDQRDIEAGSRLSKDVNEGISSGSAYQTNNALMEGRAKAATPLYKEAFDANQNIASPQIDRILQTPAGKQALTQARVKMQNDMTLMGKPDPELMDQAREAGQVIAGRRGVASGLKLRTLDYVKRALDDQIGVAVRDGEKDNVVILSRLKSDFVKALDDADITAKAGPNSLKPEGGAYARARAVYSGASQSMDALEQGQKFLTSEPEEIAAALADMTPGDKEFYRLGAASALRKAIAKTGTNGDEAKRILGNDYARQQLDPLFDSKEKLDTFINNVTAERTMFNTRYDTFGNSRTASRVAEDGDKRIEAGLHAADAVSHTASGNIFSALHAGWRARRAMRGLMDPRVNEEIAGILSTPLNDPNSVSRGLLGMDLRAPNLLPLPHVRLPRHPALPLYLSSPQQRQQ